MGNYKSPLHEMSCTTPTQFWNDSCSISDLTYALEHGAVGATTNPVIVGEVMKRELAGCLSQIKGFIREMPKATEDEIAWRMNESMAAAGAKLLLPVFEQTDKKAGRISIQTDTKFYRDESRIVKQAEHFHRLAENIMVKMPATAAGIDAIEECTYKGIHVNATVCFSVSQAIAAGDAIERALARRRREGLNCDVLHPVCTIMVGRLDDWLRAAAEEEGVTVDPDCLDYAGVAVFKNAYRIFKAKNYKTRLLAAAYRNHYHWSSFIGGDISMTIPPKWIRLFNNSRIPVLNRMDEAVEPRILGQLQSHFPDFVRAYEPDGMKVHEFEHFGAARRTLMQFLEGYDAMVAIIRSVMVNI